MFLANSTMPQPILDQCTIMLQNTNSFEPLLEQSSHGKPVQILQTSLPLTLTIL